MTNEIHINTMIKDMFFKFTDFKLALKPEQYSIYLKHLKEAYEKGIADQRHKDVKAIEEWFNEKVNEKKVEGCYLKTLNNDDAILLPRPVLEELKSSILNNSPQTKPSPKSLIAKSFRKESEQQTSKEVNVNSTLLEQTGDTHNRETGSNVPNETIGQSSDTIFQEDSEQ